MNQCNQSYNKSAYSVSTTLENSSSSGNSSFTNSNTPAAQQVRIPHSTVENRGLAQSPATAEDFDNWLQQAVSGQAQKVTAAKAGYQAEWTKDSCVSPGIVTANVQWLEGPAALEAVAGVAFENAEQQDFEKGENWRAQRTRDRYSSIELGGGWYATGQNPLNNWERSEYGQLKPAIPRKDKDGKAIKYETPGGQRTQAIFLTPDLNSTIALCLQANLAPRPALQAIAAHTPAGDWLHIALAELEHTDFAEWLTQYEHEPMPGFWPWVQASKQIPIVLTEGTKKAGAQLTAGTAAIALPGVWNGHRQKDSQGEQLAIEDYRANPEIAAMLEGGRDIVLVFDQDSNTGTREGVGMALIRLGNTLTNAHGCKVTVATWDNQAGAAKGADDLIAVAGAAAYQDAIAQAISLKEFEKQYCAEHGTEALRLATKGERKSKTAQKAEWQREKVKGSYEKLADLLHWPVGKIAAMLAIEDDDLREAAARGLFFKPFETKLGARLSGEAEQGSVTRMDLEMLANGGRALAVYDASRATAKSSEGIVLDVLDTALRSERSLIIVPTRALASSLAAKINQIAGSKIACTHQHKERGTALIVVTCPESLWRFDGADFKTLAIDEVNEGAERVQSGALGNSAEDNARVYEQLLSKAQTVIIATADMWAWSLHAVQRASGITPAQTHIQRRVREKTEMTIIEYSNYWQWIAEIVRAIEWGQKVVIPMGARGKARALHKYLRSYFAGKGKRGFITDARFTGKKTLGQFLANPDAYLAENQFDWFIFSPVINSGVSIEGQHFNTQFEYSCPNESAQKVGQRGERIRSAVGRDGKIRWRHIYYSEQGAPTLEAYPEALDACYWADELAAKDAAPMGAAAGMAKALGVDKLISSMEKDRALNAELRPELHRFMALEAFDIFFKRELLHQEWNSYGWAVEPAPKMSPDELERCEEIKLSYEQIAIGQTKTQGKALHRANPTLADHETEYDDAANLFQNFRIDRARLNETCGAAFLDGQNAEFFTAWFADESRSNPGLSSVVRSRLLMLAVEQPETFAILAQLKAFKFLAGKSQPHESFNLPDLPAPARDIELTAIMIKCPGIAAIVSGQLETWTNKTPEVTAAAAYLIEHDAQLRANTKRKGLLGGLKFSAAMKPAELVNKALKLFGFETAKHRDGGRGRMNVHRLATVADTEQWFAAKLAEWKKAEEENELISPLKVFRAEMRLLRSKTAAELCGAVNAQLLAKLAQWAKHKSDCLSAMAALKRRHTSLLDISLRDTCDDPSNPSLGTAKGGPESSPPPQNPEGRSHDPKQLVII